MSRTASTALIDHTKENTIYPIFLVSMETASTAIFLHTGVGESTFGGNTYQGAGDFLAFGEVEESAELAANGVRFSLSGIPSTLLSESIGSIQWGKPIRLYFGAKTSTGFIGTPYLAFEGITDVSEVEEGADTSVISIIAENRLVDLERPRTRRYTTEDQQIRDPGDLGFEYVPFMKDQEITFGG